MQKIIYICDKCKSQIEGDGVAIDRMKVGDQYVNGVNRLMPENLTRHLCAGCTEKMVRWIQQGPSDTEGAENPALTRLKAEQAAAETEAQTQAQADDSDPYDDVPEYVPTEAEAEAEAEPDDTREQIRKELAAKKKPAAVKRPPLDKGKIKALHEGGWSAGRIADEMGCTPQAIRQHLKGMGLT